MGIRLAVVDGHPLCRHGLRHIVADEPDIAVTGEAATMAEVPGLLAGGPGVLVAAAALPDGDGFALVRGLRAHHPELGSVILAEAGHDGPLLRAMESGASAYAPKSAAAAEIVAAIRHAAVAPHSFSAAGLVAALGRRRAGELLSPRERQVLVLLMEGRSIAAIARTMHLSHSTAKTYTARLYEKLGAANRTQAVMTALRLGLVHQDDRPAGADFREILGNSSRSA